MIIISGSSSGGEDLNLSQQILTPGRDAPGKRSRFYKSC